MKQTYSITILGYTHEGLTVSHGLLDSDWPIEQIARITKMGYSKVVHLSILSVPSGEILFLEETPIS
jgi:hypothetical protein